jgi:G3E family GTPase
VPPDPASSGPIKDVATHLITGFLGVGKTSAILSLLAQKPEHEKWAVLVNEFGHIGIDGAIYASRGVEVEEIPGGCMCCLTGVPLQVAVNRLLKSARPDRLLIETSGLGHPRGVLKTLREEHFKSVLDIRSTICLVNPNHLLDSRYLKHEIYQQQITMSDLLIANKTDLASQQALRHFDDLAVQSPLKLLTAKTRKGEMQVNWLDLRAKARHAGPLAYQFKPGRAHQRAHSSVGSYQSKGWSFSEEIVFSHSRIVRGLAHIEDIERLKAVLITDQGNYIFNRVDERLDQLKTGHLADSRLEIIAANICKKQWDEIGSMLDACKV